MAKLKIELNDIQNIRDLLQETYRLADEQIVQAQNEINKLSVSTQLEQEAMDAKSKYAKAINDYLGMKTRQYQRSWILRRFSLTSTTITVTLRAQWRMVRT